MLVAGDSQKIAKMQFILHDSMMFQLKKKKKKTKEVKNYCSTLDYSGKLS